MQAEEQTQSNLILIPTGLHFSNVNLPAMLTKPVKESLERPLTDKGLEFATGGKI